MIRTSVVLVLATCLTAVAAPALVEKPGQGKAADLERKLIGDWDGAGPCDGDLTIRADGTFVRTGHGPDGQNSAGNWAVRWDALPPTLVLTCQASDDPEDVGKVTEVKLVELNDDALAYTHPDAPKTSRKTRYMRVGR
jgi:hypothetical protein